MLKISTTSSAGVSLATRFCSTAWFKKELQIAASSVWQLMEGKIGVDSRSLE
jgi:hypothetical protein